MYNSTYIYIKFRRQTHAFVYSMVYTYNDTIQYNTYDKLYNTYTHTMRICDTMHIDIYIHTMQCSAVQYNRIEYKLQYSRAVVVRRDGVGATARCCTSCFWPWWAAPAMSSWMPGSSSSSSSSSSRQRLPLRLSNTRYHILSIPSHSPPIKFLHIQPTTLLLLGRRLLCLPKLKYPSLKFLFNVDTHSIHLVVTLPYIDGLSPKSITNLLTRTQCLNPNRHS